MTADHKKGEVLMVRYRIEKTLAVKKFGCRKFVRKTLENGSPFA